MHASCIHKKISYKIIKIMHVGKDNVIAFFKNAITLKNIYILYKSLEA